MDPFGQQAALEQIAAAGLVSFSMELMPRITRAQSMDVLSSQANLAGYRAVIDASASYGPCAADDDDGRRHCPGRQDLRHGRGRRRAAGYRHRSPPRRRRDRDGCAAGGQGAGGLARRKFIAVEDEEFKQAESAAGYAKPMSPEYQAKQAALVAEHIKKQDIVVTTALIPGRPAPRLINAAMVASMRAGSVIVDLAVERGGNVEGAVSGQEIETPNGVRILGHSNTAGRIAASASALYARNLLNFVETLIDKTTKAVSPNWDDELVRATLLTRDGAVVHPTFKAAA